MVGKTVLLESFRPIANQHGWLWAGTDLSESVSVNETLIAGRILADLSSATSSIPIEDAPSLPPGLVAAQSMIRRFMDYATLLKIFEITPGLIADKLKTVLKIAWDSIKRNSHKGLIFAYDESQTMSDNVAREQYPFSLFIDVFNRFNERIFHSC